MRPQSMAQTVKDLEEAGRVLRRADPADGRRSFVEVTPSGRQILEETRAQREDWLTRALDSELDARERELPAGGAQAPRPRRRRLGIDGDPLRPVVRNRCSAALRPSTFSLASSLTSGSVRMVSQIGALSHPG